MMTRDSLSTFNRRLNLTSHSLLSLSWPSEVFTGAFAKFDSRMKGVTTWWLHWERHVTMKRTWWSRLPEYWPSRCREACKTNLVKVQTRLFLDLLGRRDPKSMRDACMVQSWYLAWSKHMPMMQWESCQRQWRAYWHMTRYHTRHAWPYEAFVSTMTYRSKMKMIVLPNPWQMHNESVLFEWHSPNSSQTKQQLKVFHILAQVARPTLPTRATSRDHTSREANARFWSTLESVEPIRVPLAHNWFHRHPMVYRETLEHSCQSRWAKDLMNN